MDDQVKHPVLKLTSAGFAWLGGLTWGEIAQILAAVYTGLLICDFIWVRWIRPNIRKHLGDLE